VEDREISIRFLAEAEFFLFPTETLSGTYPKFTGVISLKAKRPARETDFTPPHGEEVIMRGAILPLPPHVLMWCTIIRRAKNIQRAQDGKRV
jgi:hypothetical protein